MPKKHSHDKLPLPPQVRIKTIVGAAPGFGDQCLFSDVKDLQHAPAYCTKHQQNCVVPAVQFFSAGFSCKSLKQVKCFSWRHGLMLATADGFNRGHVAFSASLLERPQARSQHAACILTQ